MRRAAIVSAAAFALLGLAAGGESREARLDPVTFVGEILPLLQKQGCASAYCHGSATGRGGFKLSLFGSDAEADHAAIVQDLGARRIDLRRPEASLVLRKPAMHTRHGGGRKLPADSEAYRLFARWIAEGAPFGSERSTGLRAELVHDRIRVTREPAAMDVTHLALVTSSDESVATVDTDGRIEAKGPGVTFFVARVGGELATTRLVRPFGERSARRSANPLDATWLAALEGLGLAPAPRAAPHALVRRLHLDLAGRVPTPAELAEFSALAPAEQVPRTVARLLASGDFAATFGAHVARWLEVPPGDTTMQARAKASVAAPGGLFALVDEAVSGRRWLERHEDPRDRAEHFARSLLGIRIGCARCHDSPLDRWTRAEHLAFSACFTGTNKLFDPESGVPVAPVLLPLDATASRTPSAVGTATPRALLATARPFLARNFANRVFAQLFGRGLVHPVDDHRATNPTWFEGLLTHLAARLEASNGDLRALVHEIATSELYALASETDPGATPTLREQRARWLALRDARELEPDALVRAIGSVLGAPLSGLRLPDEPLARELALLNGPWFDEAIAHSDLSRLELAGIFERVLSRAPTSDELAAFSALDRRDVVFALLASREFRSIR